MNDPENAAMNTLFSSVRALLITVGSALVTGGVLTKESPLYFWIMLVAGAIMVVGPAAWGAWVAFQHVLAVRQAKLAGVTAGAAIVVAGEAKTVDGKLIPGGTGDGALLPFTQKTAAETIAKFAPPELSKVA